MQGLFITGTDTGVGKTHLGAAIVRRLRMLGVRTGAYKPVASGVEAGARGPVWGDVERLHAALDGKFARERICPQRFAAPLAPPLAARDEGRQVDARLLRTGANWWRGQVDFLVIEGAGGLLSPASDDDSNADLAVDLQFPLLVVARRTLGTINHTLLTIEAALRRGLEVAGIILNDAVPVAASDVSVSLNAAELAARTNVPVLACFEYAPQADLLILPDFLRIDFVELASSRGGREALGP